MTRSTSILFACGLAILALSTVSRAADSAMIVASDGTGTHKTVQSALDAIPENNTESRTITIKPGTYKEHLQIPKSKQLLTFRGDDKDATKTVITFDRHSGMDDPEAPGKKVGTSGSESVLVLADNFSAENITFENSAGEVGQAVAVRTMSDRVIFRNCRFLGWQDTLYTNGKRTYLDNCYIEGRTDFIFGRATAVFDRCTIYTKRGSYITAASTNPQVPFGLVFLDCKITGDETKPYLGRPWKEGSATAFIRCDLADQIRPEGWSEWKPTENHKTARYSEYKCTGGSADRAQRPEWTKELSDEEAKAYTVENILSGDDHWDPKSPPK